jgi:hypothetical protein
MREKHPFHSGGVMVMKQYFYTKVLSTKTMIPGTAQCPKPAVMHLFKVNVTNTCVGAKFKNRQKCIRIVALCTAEFKALQSQRDRITSVCIAQ